MITQALKALASEDLVLKLGSKTVAPALFDTIRKGNDFVDGVALRGHKWLRKERLWHNFEEETGIDRDELKEQALDWLEEKTGIDVDKLVDSTTETLDNAKDSVVEGASNAIETITNGASEAWESIADGAGNALEFVSEVLSELV